MNRAVRHVFSIVSVLALLFILPSNMHAIGTTSSAVTTSASMEETNSFAEVSSEQQADPFYLEYIDTMINLGDADPIDIATALINIALGFLAILFVCLVLLSGTRFLFSMGDAEKMKRARQTLTHAIVGLFIIFISYSLVVFIFDSLITATGGNPL